MNSLVAQQQGTPMSNAYQRRLALAGIDTSGLSADELRALVRQILEFIDDFDTKGNGWND